MNIQISNPSDYRVALYIRLSKEDANGGESESVTNQRNLLMSFAEQNKLDVFDTYIDDGYSGTNFERPGFLRMIGDIEAQKVNMVITKDMSRLGRDYIQTGYYMERFFPEKSVRYLSLLDGVDTGVDSSVNDITPFKAIMNDMYARDISKKISSVKREKQKKGLFIGGKAPYGYVLSQQLKNTIIIDEEAASVVHMMFQLALDGVSCRQITMYLNENGIPPPSVYAGIASGRKGPFSGLWSSERVTAMLKNRVYVGDMVQGRVRKINYKLKKCRRLPPEEWTIVKGTHEPIVSREDFDKVQLLIESRRHTRERTHDFPLKGLLYCHECGYPLAVIMRTLAGNRQTLYTVCRIYQRNTKLRKCTCHCMRVDIITDAVVQKLREICSFCLDQQQCGAIITQSLEEYKADDTREKELAGIATSIDELNTQLDQMYSDKLSCILDEADFQRIYSKAKANRTRLLERKNKLETETAMEIDTNTTADELINRFFEGLDTNRELLVSLVEKVEITEDKEIRILFRFKFFEALSHLQ